MSSSLARLGRRQSQDHLPEIVSAVRVFRHLCFVSRNWPRTSTARWLDCLNLQLCIIIDMFAVNRLCTIELGVRINLKVRRITLWKYTLPALYPVCKQNKISVIGNVSEDTFGRLRLLLPIAKPP